MSAAIQRRLRVYIRQQDPPPVPLIYYEKNLGLQGAQVSDFLRIANFKVRIFLLSLLNLNVAELEISDLELTDLEVEELYILQL